MKKPARPQPPTALELKLQARLSAIVDALRLAVSSQDNDSNFFDDFRYAVEAAPRKPSEQLLSRFSAADQADARQFLDALIAKLEPLSYGPDEDGEPDS